MPKRIALQKAEQFCMITVMPIHYISKILSPFIKLLSISTKGVLKLLRMKTEDQEEIVTEEEIKAMLKMGSRIRYGRRQRTGNDQLSIFFRR